MSLTDKQRDGSRRSMTLRPATPGDVQALRRWDQQPHVIASNPYDDWGWETELNRSPDWRQSLIAEIDGRPIGFLEIIDAAQEDSRYWGDVPSVCGRLTYGSGKHAIWARAMGQRQVACTSVSRECAEFRCQDGWCREKV